MLARFLAIALEFQLGADILSTAWRRAGMRSVSLPPSPSSGRR
jgi:hypothetical protein